MTGQRFSLSHNESAVVVALETVDAGREIRFRGIDLETGDSLTIRVIPDRPSPEAKQERLHASGLILTLSIALSPTRS